METQTIFNSPYVEIELNTDLGIIRANWKGFLKIHDLLEGMEHLLEGVNNHGVQRHISDQTELRVLSKEIKDYLVNDGLDRMEAAGLKKVGVIQSSDFFAQSAVDRVNKDVVLKELDIQAFLSEKDCVEWLTSS